MLILQKHVLAILFDFMLQLELNCTWREREIQCDQIGRILKVLDDMVSIKSSPNAWGIFGLKWKATLFMLTYCSYFFGQVLEKFGLLFNLASGHSWGNIKLAPSRKKPLQRHYSDEASRIVSMTMANQTSRHFLQSWRSPASHIVTQRRSPR